MNLQEGSRVAESTAPIADLLKDFGQGFKGCIYVCRPEPGPDSEGFILIADGKVLAAMLSCQGINLYRLDALHRMMSLEGIRSKIVELTDGQIQTAVAEAPADAIIAESAAPGKQPQPQPVPKEKAEYDHILSLVTSLPGVAAAAFVADGLPVFQQGNADFEHIAAATEDMVRTGGRIAGELQLGAAEQIIIETPGYKVIIAPVSDMFLCVLARGETNLGLIRLNIRNMQENYRLQG
jgi:predicted regulator of Ras-like GTPase activity (Roadblock/LC7/MglB family)